METKREFLYADKKEQLKRANRFLIMGFAVFYAAVLGTVIFAGLSGWRSMGFTVLVSSISILAFAGDVGMYLNDKSNVKLRYFSVISMFIVAAFVSYAFDSYYVRFLTIVPLIGYIVFYDLKFSVVTSVIMVAIHMVIIAIKCFVVGSYTGDVAFDQWSANLVIALMLVLVPL